MAVLVSHVDAHITYVEKEGPLIKIFAQLDKQNSCFVERLLYQLRETFESNNDLMPKTLEDLKVGLICCAKFDDGVYYRARIESMESIREYKVTVVFIDHGNAAKVHVQHIRLISKLLEFFKVKRVHGLAEMQGLAHEFYAGGVAPKDKEWDDSTLDYLRKKLCNTDVKFAVYEVEGKKCIKVIKPDNHDPSQLLTSLSKGFPVPLNAQERMFKKLNEKKLQMALPQHFNVPPPSLLMQQPPLARLPNVTQPPPVRPSTEFNTLSNVLPSQGVAGRLGSRLNPLRHSIPGISMRRPEVLPVNPPVQSLQFSTEMLAPGVSHPVFVSHVEDGPLSFAVQLQSVVQDVLIQMMADLDNLKPQPITAPLNPGSICLGRYTEDGSLCRAIVMNVLDDKVKLYFADFGNSEILPYSEIFQIPPKFVTPKVMSHRFTLANIKDVEYTEQEKNLFKKLVTDSRGLLMRVTPPEANPLKQYCELYLNCKNIKHILQELSQAQPLLRYIPLSTPIKGSQEKVFVSFVLNPGRFFVQLDKNSFSLNQVMSCVANHCRTAAHIPLVNIRAGESCCALYEDNKWYRAEILKLNPDNKAFINFVDFGNQEEIELANLRQTTNELVTTVKAQALVCCLRGYELRYDVEEEVSNRLEELILEKKLMMHVLGSTESGVLIVQLIDSNGDDIGSQLEVKPSQSPIYNSYQATAAPSKPKPSHTPSADEWEDTPQVSTNARMYSDSRGPSEDGKKSWRPPREDGETAPRFRSSTQEGGRWNEGAKPDRRFNRDGEDKPWNKGDGRFNKDENRGARFNKDEDDGGRYMKSGERGNRFYDDDKGGRFGRDNDSRGGRFNEDGGGRFNSDKRFGERGNRFNEDRGNRFGEDGGGRFNKPDASKPWRKREDNEESGWKEEDDTGGFKKGRDREEGGGWKDRSTSGGWKQNSGDGWKEGGDYKRFDNSDSGFKRSGGFRDGGGDRSSFKKSWEKGGSGDSYDRAAPKSPKPDTVGGMPPSSAKVGMIENTQVVYTTSPVEFYVQLNSSFEELNQLMEKITAACDSGDATDMTSVQEKSGCLAKFSDDDAWYRGYVEETEFDSVKVLFVDYGNREKVPSDKIKNLPEDLSLLPVQAIKCRLFGVPEAAEVDAFSDLVTEKTLKTQFVSKHFLTKSFQVVMVDEESGTNINTAMGASEEEVQAVLSKMGLTSLYPLSLMPGTTVTAQMTWYLSPSQFYLQPMDSNPEFRAMMQSMQTMVRTGSVIQNNQLNVGDYVIARFKVDKVLYRALVKEAGFAPTVQYVDYGNTEAVDSGSVWVMEAEYATLPMQAFSCCLAGVQPKGEAWPKADTTELDVQFEADTLDCTITRELEGEPQYLVKLVNKGEDVAQKIIDTGFAVAGSDAIGVASELDMSLVVGQLLSVSLLHVEDAYTFFVKPATEDVELQSLESTAGGGFKCVLSSVKEDATDEQLKQLPVETHVIILVDAVTSDGLQVTLYDAEGELLPLQERDNTKVDKICPLPVLNTHQRIYVAHASDEGIFLQKAAFSDLVSDLLQKLYEFYNESESVEQDWAEGEICCAKSVFDEQWYRAKIVETGEEIKVQYIDYGNSETLPVSNLRKLDPSFCTAHAFALKTSLHVSWTVPVENFMELAGDTVYNAVVLRNSEGWVVELVDDSGQSVTDKLVELGFAVALENSPFKRVVEGGRFVEGSNVPVSVPSIDSPLQLWILVKDEVEYIEELQDRLQEAAPKLLPLKEPSGIFAAKYSDGLWYRAVKLNGSMVRFIDYGNSNEVDMSDIKALSADFLERSEGYAVKVELPMVDFKEGATEELVELLVSQEIDPEEKIIAHVLSVKECSIVADILKGGKSVVDVIVEKNLGTRLQKVSSGFVSHFNSLSDFFIQEVGCEEALDEVASVMLTAESFELISEVNEGEIVAALYATDGLWYRAKVIKKTEEGLEVLFVDYGNSVTTTSLRALPPDLVNKPILSKHCTLKLPNGVSEWSQSANEKFIEISADGCTKFDLKILDEKDPATVILTCNGECITEQLKVLCDVVESNVPTSESSPCNLTEYDKTVYISHVNSPSDFYVQLEGTEDDIDAIKEELRDTSSFDTLESISEDLKGTIIGAQFVEDDCWYRAKVLNTTDDGAEVLFVDFGNTAIATKFVKLPETLKNKIPLLIHCSLGGENWPEEATNYFSELSSEGNVPFKMKVLEDRDPSIVSLVFEENRIVENELVFFFKKLLHEEIEDKPSSPKISAEDLVGSKIAADDSMIKTVYLIQVNSPSDFFLHTSEATQLIAEISEQLVTAEDFASIEETSISKGNIVAAQFDEDDLWYRAKIIDHSDSETKVLFIDYGHTAKVAKIKHLPEDLVAIPPLAMHCSLQLLGGNEWSSKACETFNRLANDDGVTFDLQIISEGDPNVVGLYINGESIAEQLILASGLVTEEHPSPEVESGDIVHDVLEDIIDRGMEEFVKDSSDKVKEDENSAFDLTNFDSTKNSDRHDVKVDTSFEPCKQDILQSVQDNLETALTTVEISHFNDTGDFYVQFIEDKQELMTISEELQHDSFETVSEDDEIVAAKYVCDDLWYRAKVLDTKISEYTVLLIDFGKTASVSELRKLPKHLTEKKPLAKHCCMKSSRGVWSATTNEKLSALAKIGGLTFEMKVLSEGDPSTIDLFIDDQSLTDTFLAQELADEQSDMQEMILQSVENHILMNLKENVQQVTDDLFLRATNIDSAKVPCTIEERNRVHTIDESKLDEDKSDNQQDVDSVEENKSNEGDFTIDTVKKGNIDVLSPNFSENGIDETSKNENNEGIDGETSKNENNKSQMKIENKEGALKAVFNGSPTMLRRSNIDEHIVPGCISSVKLEETPPKS